MLTMISNAVPEESLTESPATPTVTHYQEVAAQFMALLNTAIVLIPAFEPFHTSLVDFVRAHQSFPNDFIATTLDRRGPRPRNALAKSAAVSYRSAGDLESAFRSTAFTASLKPSQYLLTGGGSVMIIACITVAQELP